MFILHRKSVPGRKALAADEDQSRSGFAFRAVSSDLRKRWLAAPLPECLALADSVPESIRIQQKAEKAYETAPVVPIDRQNAHHRDVSKDGVAPGDDDRDQPIIIPYVPRRDSDR
jgi:hypothetical protein